MKVFLFSILSIWMHAMALAFWWHVYLAMPSFSIVENAWEAAGQVWALLCYSAFAVACTIFTIYGVQRALGLRSD